MTIERYNQLHFSFIDFPLNVHNRTHGCLHTHSIRYQYNNLLILYTIQTINFIQTDKETTYTRLGSGLHFNLLQIRHIFTVLNDQILGFEWLFILVYPFDTWQLLGETGEDELFTPPPHFVDVVQVRVVQGRHGRRFEYVEVVEDWLVEEVGQVGEIGVCTGHVAEVGNLFFILIQMQIFFEYLLRFQFIVEFKEGVEIILMEWLFFF